MSKKELRRSRSFLDETSTDVSGVLYTCLGSFLGSHRLPPSQFFHAVFPSIKIKPNLSPCVEKDQKEREILKEVDSLKRNFLQDATSPKTCLMS
jgi:hypothetical protein